MVDKLREVIRNIQNTILTSAMPLKYKIAFFVTLPFSPITKKVYWFGRPFLTDNRLGCFLLPGYIIEILNLKKVLGTSSNVMILDIGANVGQFACTALALTNWNIHSFEPNKKIYEMLTSNTRPGKVITNNVGFGANSNKVKLYFVEGKSAQGSVSKQLATKGLTGKMNFTEIKLVTVESYLRLISPSSSTCLVMKVDVEGMEMEVIGRLGDYIFDVIQLEYTPGSSGSLESFINQVQESIKIHNYNIYDLESYKGDNPRNIIFKNKFSANL